MRYIIFGESHGPAVGVALNALLDRVAQGELNNDREALLRELDHFQEGM